MPWNPDQYHKFQAQRAAPFHDALACIKVRPHLRVVDLGCGTGELTAQLADALPESDVMGIDSSAEMLAKATPLSREGLSFEQASLETVTGEWDVVFSHAAIQWVDDHATLIPKLFGLVAPGGQLVVQQPANHRHPSHTLAAEIAAIEPFRSTLGGWSRQFPALNAEAYADLLFRSGADYIVVFEKIYPHVLEDADAIAEWTSGARCSSPILNA